jgi:putative transposase
VLIHRNYKYRIYPTKSQSALLNQHFFASNQAWNHALALKMLDLKENSDLPSGNRNYKKDKDIETSMKCELKQRGIVYHSGIVQESFKNMNLSLKKFYKKRKTSTTIGFPKFRRSEDIEQSFRFKNQGVSWTSKEFKILKQKIKWNFHRPIPESAKLNGVTIKRSSDGKHWAILNLSIEHDSFQEDTGLECGIDMNVKNLSITDSAGNSYPIQIPDFSKSKYSKTYQKVQKQLSKRYLKKNFSKNTKRIQKKLNKIHQRIKNQKENFYHQISKDLTDNFDRITIEDLKIKQMKESQSTPLNRMISDVSWNSLISKLKYKSEMKNRIVREVNPAYSSQRCNACGSISPFNRKSQSDFHCGNCGHHTNADSNASKNILEYDTWLPDQKARLSLWTIESLSASCEDKSIRSSAL